MHENLLHFRLRWFVKSVLLIIFQATMIMQLARSQDIYTIRGKVIDQVSKDPLPGVSVRSKQSAGFTITDEEGKYIIQASDKDTLFFSYIGYIEKKTGINGKKEINVALRSRATRLNDLVVIGYGSVKKQDLTGSVGTVNMDDLTKAPVASFDQALAGRIAGVRVSSDEGQPGSEMNIVIRGGNSLTQSNAPLYVIDGFPIEDFSSAALNPSDIASISVLKDASATAIYGSRGANGVVIIETKKGEAGKSVITYEGSVGFQQVTKKMQLMSPYEFVKYQTERDPAFMVDLYLTQPGRTLDDYKDVKGIDWQDMLSRDALMQTHRLSLSGGTDKTKYAVSGSVFDGKGVIINSGYKRYQGRLSLSHTINKKLRAAININYSKDLSYGQLSSAAQSGSNSYSTYLLYQVWGYRPIVSDSEYFDIYEDPFDPEANDNRVNPIVSAENILRQRRRTDFRTDATIHYKVLEDLDFKTQGGIRNRLYRYDNFYNSETRQGYPSPGNLKGVNGAIDYREYTDWMNENTLTYNPQLNKDNALNIIAGFTLQGTNEVRYGYDAYQVPNEQLGMSGIDDGLPGSIGAYKSRNMLVSYLGRVNYGFKSRYLLTLSFRADGSSKFSPANRWGYFPSGAIAWRMDKEKFMKGLGFISESKLRVSYGLTGNNRVDDYARYSSLNLSLSSYYSFNNATPSPGIEPDGIGNSDLEWEKTAQADIGYDLSLFKDRINLTLDLYQKITSDLLLDANLPTSTGFKSIYKNVGKIRNRGLEISLNTVNVNTKSFRWESNFNISFNRNKVLALSEGEDNIRSTVNWTGVYKSSFLYMAKVGDPAAAFYGYVWDGVYQYDDFDKQPNNVYTLKKVVPANGDPRENIQPGDIKYKDLNGDGIVNDQDMVVIGRCLPIHIGGFNNDFSYKRFSLNVFFQWSYGNDIFNANRIVFEGNPYNRSNLNQFSTYNNRWTPDNPSNLYYRIGGQGPTGVYSSRTVEDGSYLRLKTVSLSYSLSPSLLKKLKMKDISIYISGQNLYTWTKYSGMDPEVSVRNSTLTPGFDYSAYPRSRTIVAGIKATF